MVESKEHPNSKFKVKAVRDALFRCACLLDDEELFQDLIYYFHFDINERLCAYQSTSDIELEPTVFQCSETLPLIIALTSVFIHCKSKVISSMFELGVNIISPKDSLPYQLLQCNEVSIHSVWLRKYSTTTSFPRRTDLQLSACNIPVLPTPFLEGLALYNSNAEHPITHLNLEDNLLDTIPSQLGTIPELKDVRFEGNPMTLMNWMTKRDWPSIKDYLVSLESRASRWNVCKIMVLGDNGVGKTSLVDSLKKKGSRRKFTFTSGMTVARNISMKTKNMKSTVKFNFWDLGSEEVFYPTHQILLSRHSIYIITFDIPTAIQQWEDDNFIFAIRIGYWLQLIRPLARISEATPTILVGTRLDQVEVSSETLEEFHQYLKQKFPREVFYFLKQIIFTSSKSGNGILALKDKIMSLADTPGFLSMIPKSWVCLHDLLDSIQSKANLPSKIKKNISATVPSIF